MNKHLNNWLDKAEGLPENTSNNNIKKEMARQGIRETREIKLCFRCSTELEEEKELDYPYYCPNCNENMYSFEAR